MPIICQELKKKHQGVRWSDNYQNYLAWSRNNWSGVGAQRMKSVKNRMREGRKHQRCDALGPFHCKDRSQRTPQHSFSSTLSSCSQVEPCYPNSSPHQPPKPRCLCHFPHCPLHKGMQFCWESHMSREVRHASLSVGAATGHTADWWHLSGSWLAAGVCVGVVWESLC